MDCLFCQIIEKKIPANIIYEDDSLIGIDDINPQAPIHKLIIPKQHISTLNALTENEHALIGHLIHKASQLAHELGISEDGYRLLANCNAGAGQTVFHIHFHLLGGRPMHWPPG